jgi:hypothetical protein
VSQAQPVMRQVVMISRSTTYQPDAELRRTSCGCGGDISQSLQATAGPMKVNNRSADRGMASNASCTRQGNAQRGVKHSDPERGRNFWGSASLSKSELAQLEERLFAEQLVADSNSASGIKKRKSFPAVGLKRPNTQPCGELSPPDARKATVVHGKVMQLEAVHLFAK